LTILQTSAESASSPASSPIIGVAPKRPLRSGAPYDEL
jgi:hypothetical protein